MRSPIHERFPGPGQPEADTISLAPAPERAVAGRPGVARRPGVAGRPAVDVTRVLTTAEIVLGAIVIAHRLARRPSAPAAHVTMGPGGWVSMKGGTVAVRPARRPWGRPRPVVATAQERAPWWARVLSAVPLQSLIR